MNSRLFLAPSLALLSIVATAQSQPTTPQQAPISQPPSTSETTQHDVVYATIDGTDLHLDVYEPADHPVDKRPAVVLIHGGGWTAFDKSTMQRMGEFLARSGFVAFAVDYRLLQGEKNRWPAQLDDVQRAVRWIRANAAKYGVDGAHIGAFGHSAGAQLACLLGMEDTRDNSDPKLANFSSQVQAVVDVDGPTDFTTHTDPEDVAFLTNFLGADPSKHPDVWRDASPAFHVSKNNAAFLIFHGTKDQSVPISQSQELYDKLKAAGVPATFTKVDDEHTYRTPEARRQLAIDSRDFFYQYLAPKK